MVHLEEEGLDPEPVRPPEGVMESKARADVRMERVMVEFDERPNRRL